ncbi:MAG: response regulator [Bacteroidales bacterium]|nr:response regulator [Bacteroidales bacterium]
MKKISSVFVAAAFLLLQPLAAGAQACLRFTHIGAEEGIPNNVVTTACQDEFGMMWIGTQDGLIRYDGRAMEIFRPEEGNVDSIYNNNIKSLCSDGNGSIYIICKFALCRYDMRNEKFVTIHRIDVQSVICDAGEVLAATGDMVYRVQEDKMVPFCDFSSHGGRITDVFRSSDGILHVGTEDGLFSVDRNGKVAAELGGVWVLTLYEDSRHNLLVGTREHGLSVYSPAGVWSSFRKAPSAAGGLCSDYVKTVCEDSYGNLWIGTLSGLNLYDVTSGEMTDVHESYGSELLSVNKIVLDRQKSVWICTKGGIWLYNQERNIYRDHPEVFSDQRTTVVSDFAENDGYLFLATEENGLIRFDKSTGRSGKYPAPGRLPSLNIQYLYMEPDGQVLWVGTRLGGLVRLDLRTGAQRIWRHDPSDPASLPHDNVVCISPYKDQLLVATNRGVVFLDRKSGALSRMSLPESVEGRYPTDFFVDKAGNCWFAVSEGLLRRNLETGEDREYFFEDKGVLGTSRIHVTMEDSKGRLWFGTSGSGLLRYNPDSDSFTSYTTKNSLLANDYIWSLAESRSGYILLTDNAGFCRFDAESGVFQNYTPEQGFPMLSYFSRGLFVDSTGEIFVSGYKNLISFRENRLPVRSSPRQIWFTSLDSGAGVIRPGDKSGILSSSLFYQKKIVLKGGSNVFAVVTSSPDFLHSNMMEFRLDGFNQSWIPAFVGHRIVYTGLRPGKYELQVRCKDPFSGEVTASNSLSVRVRPPWYWSALSRFVYALLLLSVVVLLLNFYLTRMRLRNSLNEEKREKDRIQETNQSKLRFFTYVSHELRTPVTLIQSQVDSLLEKNNVPPFIYNKVLGIGRNLGKINSLLDELRDFRKQEQGGEIPVTFSENDLVPQLDRVSLVFKEYAQSRGIDFSFRDECGGPAVIWSDEAQIDKVLYNLISNALKNTPAGGSVSLAASQDGSGVRITVSDTGRGIPQKYLDSIWQPFFQVPDSPAAELGTGLGLGITKGIVEAHGGTISCSSTENVGTSFTVFLPKGDAHVPEGKKAAQPSSEAEKPAEESPLLDDKFIEGVKRSRGDLQPSILIVEDNGELRDYLATLFAPIYSVTTACDGLDAWEKLSHNVPDIILSDLMMPGMDGNELCLKVKNNFYTSHIPFVILTAKVAEESILESLRNSADDYITKPFNPKILISKCNNLVNTRIGLQQKFAKSSSAGSELLATNEIDRDFIEKAMRIVRENLTDSEFDVGRFASEMALGRTLFFTKLKGLTGQTPNRFITTVRLKYARELLSDKAGHSVSEVSYMCGFSTPSYFIKTFKSFYGLTPSAFRDKL